MELSHHRGIVDYDPQELVLTARSGTPLAEIESLLEERGQKLPFEPPHFGPGATLGGTIACGLAGPARASAGATRDFVLGVRMLNGVGEVLRFGGHVMKNVAGYDVARLMVGALGTLGVLLEVSLKVLPRPASSVTLGFCVDAAQALARMTDWACTPLPVSATCWVDGGLYARVCGSSAAVAEARRRMGGEEVAAGDAFWVSIREHTHLFFQSNSTLWRLNVPPSCPPSVFPVSTLIEWNGAQRWLSAAAPDAGIQTAAASCGGFATRFRGVNERGDDVFAPLPVPLLRLHRQLKKAFDPHAILNPGRLYADL